MLYLKTCIRVEEDANIVTSNAGGHRQDESSLRGLQNRKKKEGGLILDLKAKKRTCFAVESAREEAFREEASSRGGLFGQNFPKKKGGYSKRNIPHGKKGLATNQHHKKPTRTTTPKKKKKKKTPPKTKKNSKKTSPSVPGVKANLPFPEY